MKSVKEYEMKIDLKAERFIWRHPLLGFLFIFIGMPVIVLVCVSVSVSTILIAFPAAWVLGLL